MQPSADIGQMAGDSPDRGKKKIVTAPRTPDPGIGLRVDQVIVPPFAAADNTITFRIEAVPRDVRIVSRSTVPAEADESSSDRRRLGISMTRIVLCNPHARINIPYDSPLLVDGFHPCEAQHRWTNGYARIPPKAISCFSGQFEIELQISSPSLTYLRGAAPASPPPGSR